MNGFYSFLLATGQAEGQPDAMSGCLSSLPFLLAIFAIFYFLIIRPQKKQQNIHQQFLDRLQEGQRVITASGIFGRIVNIEPLIVTLDVGDRTRIKFLRSQISRYQSDIESNERTERPAGRD